MALKPPHKKRTSQYGGTLCVLITLIALFSMWSILCSHLFMGTNNISNVNVHLHSPNNLKSHQTLGVNRSMVQKANSEFDHKFVSLKTETNTAPKENESATAKKLNSEIYNPPPPTNTSRRLITYNRHGGRLNNQLIQFIGSIQHAQVLKRKLIVPDEKVAVEWTGLLDEHFEIWDLSSLKKEYEIDWSLGLDLNKERAEKEGVLSSQIPKECVLNKIQLGALLAGGPEHWRQWDEKCPDIINLGGELPLCTPKHSFCGDSEALNEAYKIYSHLKLSPYMQSLLPQKQPLSVHSRRAGEGGYDWEICTGPTKLVCNGHIEREEWKKYCNERTLKGNCALWSDLSYAIKSKHIWKQNQKHYRFNLASDGTHDWSIDYDGQFIMANSTPWLVHMDEVVQNRIKNQKRTLLSLGKSYFIRDRLRNQKDLLLNAQGIMYQLSSTILEMFSLVNADYFVGGIYSTLSLNVCLLRGFDRIMDSNMCWMLIHPYSKYAIPPPVEDTINIQVNENEDSMDEMPPALMSDIEHAFVSSNDGKFFVIDRYRFMHRKPTDTGKIPTYIAVLGQGIVPMTVEKLIGGEKNIHANFTCSMGKQKDSKASIYILDDAENDASAKGNPQTIFIVCDELKYDNDVTIQAPLLLQSHDKSFSVQIGSHLVGARNVPRRSWDGSIPTYGILNCLVPTDTNVQSGWLRAYLAHHKALKIKSHIHIYNVNWHSPDLQSILSEYRKEKLVSRHDWSKQAKSKSSATDDFVGSLARPAARMDCMLRSRGIDGFAIFGGITEVIDETAVATLKSCQENNTERCGVDVSVTPKELMTGDLHLPPMITANHETRQCVNIKSIDLAPWTLIH